jgi:hypothetical protein
MKRLLAGLALALLTLAAAKPAWAGPVDPYITLDTPPPYHFGGTIEVTTHGDIHHTSRLQMFCYQSGALVYIESIDASVTETAYTLHFGLGRPGDIWQGGGADCEIRFSRNAKNGQPGFDPYTVFDIAVEA